MSPMLTDMPSDRLDALIKHPFHRETVERLVGFIRDLRECRTPENYVAFQQDLLHATLAANAARAERSRVIKRLRRGQKLPADAPDLVVGDPHDLDDWRLEQDVLERVGRQLRSIGDAMAWQAFHYDRRHILALRRNESPGPMTLSKEGTVHEIQFAHQQWIEHRQFAMLHDLTDCLRIGDVTVFTKPDRNNEQDILLYELKTNPNRREGPQLERTRLAAEALHRGGPLPGHRNARLIDTGVPYATHLSALADAFDHAHRDGLKTMRVPGQRGLLTLDIHAAGNRWSSQEATRQFKAQYNALLRRTRLTGQRVCYGSGDSAARNHLTAPWGIYPLQPTQCAGLIADVLVFTVTLSSDNFVEELRRAGLDVRWVLPEGTEIESAPHLLEINGHGRRLQVARAEIERVLLELTDLQTWAEGMDRLLEKTESRCQPWPYFTEEHQVWA
ncbi:hypothetical protein OG713_45895 (plasmid) [Streptomyces sp. NBC_00723]|uniref:hypothetical protein n=1 Tax=Streptomyces sp. NBC_00723 TaxID=2903673 RepID=UPI002F91B64A